MPKCTVKKCKNNTSNSLKKDGVSYFRFPKNEIEREKWRKKIANDRGEEFFKPNDSSVVCSCHFAESDMYYTKKGYRKVKKGVLPRVETDVSMTPSQMDVPSTATIHSSPRNEPSSTSVTDTSLQPQFNSEVTIPSSLTNELDKSADREILLVLQPKTELEDLDNFRFWKTMGARPRLKPRPPPSIKPVQKLYKVKAPQDPPQPKLKQLQRQELVVKYDQPGTSTATQTQVRVRSDLAADDVNSDHTSRDNETLQDPLSKEEIQCRICGELYKDLILAVNKPYLTENKATLALNDMSVDIDLNSDELPTVCVDCDGRLLDMFNFINHVKTVQESLSVISGNITDAVETLVIKIEAPDDDVAEIEAISENAFVKQINNTTKRKSDNVDAQKAKVRKGDSAKKIDTTKKGSDNMQPKKVIKGLTIDTRKESIQQTNDIVTEDLMMDIKKEIDDIVENEMVSENSELIDTGTDVNPGLEQLDVLGSEMSSGNLGSGSEQGESEVIEVNLDNFP